MKVRRITICLLLIISFVLSTLTISGNSQNSQWTLNIQTSTPPFFTQFQVNFESPDGNPITGYSKIPNGDQLLAMDQALVALDYLNSAEQLPNSTYQSFLLQKALAVLKFSTSYLKDPYSRSRIGVVMFYDTNLQDNSYTRSPRLARDQALMILALDKVLNLLDSNTSTYVRYDDLIKSFWSYLDSFYDYTYGGWYTKTTPISLTNTSMDTSKSMIDNSFIILSLLSVSNATRAGITTSLIINHVHQTLDFLYNHFHTTNGGVLAVSLADGSNISQGAYFANANALFGLANLAFYLHTSNTTYLNRAIESWEFLKNNLWESGFGGVFGGVNSFGDPIIAGKTLEDQVLFALLSEQLIPYETYVNGTEHFLDYYIHTNQILKLRFVSGTTVWSSADRRLYHSNETFLQSTGLYQYYLNQVPHIIDVTSPESVIIGTDIPVNVDIYNSGLSLNLTITGGSSFEKITQITNLSQVNYNLHFLDTVQSGNYPLDFTLYLAGNVLGTIEININLTPNVRIPSGLLYLGGAGILAVVVLVIRRPPERLKKIIAELNIKQYVEKAQSENKPPSNELKDS